MKISHDSTFWQIAVAVQTMRGTAVDLTNFTREEGLCQVLPGGTILGISRITVYRGVVKFLSPQDA